jgi:hypothetical protein
MARMDYVIICQVIALLNERGLTDDELSFLLGKPNNYVFGFIVKPSDKNRFTEDQLDLLPFILNCSFGDIIPDGTEKGNIQLYHAKQIDDDYKGFSHITYAPTGEGTRIIWKKKKAPKGSTRKTNESLLDLLKLLVKNGYFDEKRNGLEIYKKIKADSEIPFRVSELEKCLKIIGGSKYNIICKKPVDGILRYWKKISFVTLSVKGVLLCP